VAYRGGKAVRGVPAAFAAFSGDDSGRTAARILAHIGDLYDWALSQAKGAEAWHDSTPLEWDREVERFHAALQQFDAYLASDAPLAVTHEKLFQGAIADSLAHVGQLAMLRRLGGAKDEERELLQGRHRRRARGIGSDGSETRIRLILERPAGRPSKS
jgi:hypothetical protein